MAFRFPANNFLFLALLQIDNSSSHTHKLNDSRKSEKMMYIKTNNMTMRSEKQYFVSQRRQAVDGR